LINAPPRLYQSIAKSRADWSPWLAAIGPSTVQGVGIMREGAESVDGYLRDGCVFRADVDT
jgi:hypothetical protein